ncbi:MAG TPA: SPOR domain-containing protein [Leeuwenhoekiella sp.]|nr:SPOR domain-containing protein [Leeuwenhoekiella sp.]
MQLENYISDLLYRYECVTVPGLGAFLSHRNPARLNREEHSFFPPQKRISFNTQVKDNDGLLAKYISNSEGISYEDSMRHIQAYVRFVKIELADKKHIELDKIGALSLTENDAIRFEPNNNVNYLTEAFGLSSLAASPVSREIAKKEIRFQEEKAPLPINRGRVWMKYAAVGMLALSLSGTMGYMYLKDIEDYNVAEKQKAETQLENQIQEATFTINNPLPTITLSAFKPSGKYHIVAGAFRKEDNAQTRVNQLREKGYKARQIGTNRFGLHQVVYGSYTDPKEALVALRDVRKNNNSGAWMLVQELEENK